MRTCSSILIGAVALVGVAPACAGQPATSEASEGAEAAEETLVRASALAERAGITPGGTVWIGVRFEIKDGWHTYWPGQNDTGLGTEITPSGPDSVAFGPIRWPAPHRYTAPGDILDHVHDGEVTALIPVTASADAPVGSTLELSFDLAWLVCDAVCIPGWKTVTLRLPVVAETGDADPATAGVFAAARARIPEPVPADGRVVTTEWEKGPDDAGPIASLRARGAFRMAFYPDQDCDRVRGLLESGATESDELRLRFDERQPTLSGVVEVFSRDGRSKVYKIRSQPGPSR